MRHIKLPIELAENEKLIKIFKLHPRAHQFNFLFRNFLGILFFLIISYGFILRLMIILKTNIDLSLFIELPKEQADWFILSLEFAFLTPLFLFQFFYLCSRVNKRSREMHSTKYILTTERIVHVSTYPTFNQNSIYHIKAKGWILGSNLWTKVFGFYYLTARNNQSFLEYAQNQQRINSSIPLLEFLQKEDAIYLLKFFLKHQRKDHGNNEELSFSKNKKDLENDTDDTIISRSSKIQTTPVGFDREKNSKKVNIDNPIKKSIKVTPVSISIKKWYILLYPFCCIWCNLAILMLGLTIGVYFLKNKDYLLYLLGFLLVAPYPLLFVIGIFNIFTKKIILHEDYLELAFRTGPANAGKTFFWIKRKIPYDKIVMTEVVTKRFRPTVLKLYISRAYFDSTEKNKILITYPIKGLGLADAKRLSALLAKHLGN